MRLKMIYKYTEEQWAHLIQMNKHYSLEEPPNKKLWKTSGSTVGSVGSSQGSSTGVKSVHVEVLFVYH